MTIRQLRLLGPVSVNLTSDPQSESGKIPRFRSKRTMALLGYLAAGRRSVARDHLAALLWPDELSSKARANLRRELHNLSQILPKCWHLERHAVAFVPSDEVTIDIYKLLELEADERWEEAVELLGGEFLEGIYFDQNLEFENWLLAERERWHRQNQAILNFAIEGHIRRGQYIEALQHSQRSLQFTPWNEDAHRQVMRLLAWTGQREAALRQFEICKQVLQKELAVEPFAETISIYRQILEGEMVSLPHLPAFLTEEGARHKVDQSVFVARERELAQLNIFLDTTLAGQGQVVMITGGPGRGKTALMDAFARGAMEEHPGLLATSGNCYTYSGVGDPYLPFREIMAMLTGDVEARWEAGKIRGDHATRLWVTLPFILQALLDQAPHLVDSLVPGRELLSRATAVEEVNPSQLARLREQVERNRSNSLDLEQTHLFQQVTNLLLTVARAHPLVLFLDDIQWADTASISLLFHLGRRLTEINSRVLIVCAYRPEELAVQHTSERHPLSKLLNEIKRSFGDVWIDLGQVEKLDGRRFVDALLDSEPNHLSETFRVALHHRTQGHPLFTIELLRAMQERGNLLKDGSGHLIEGPNLDWQLLPARVEAVIEERIDRLDQESQELLTIASVEGEIFTAQVVAEVQNIPERQLLQKFSQDLDSQHRLISDEGEVRTSMARISRFRFGHVLYQDFLYNRISMGERRLLHNEIAVVLEKLYHEQLDEMAVRIAHHSFNAKNYEKSFRYFNMAAERAARIHANDEAIRHYTRALEMAEKVPLDNVTTVQIRRGRGLAYSACGEFDRARADLESALHEYRVLRNNQLEWRTLIDLGKLSASQDYNQARGYFQQALEMARHMNEPAVLAVSLNRMGNWLANDERPLEAVAYHQEALEIFEQIGNTRDIANTLDLLGIAHLLAGDYIASVEYYNRAIPLFQELDDRPRLISSLIGRGVIASLVILLAMVPHHPASDARQDFREAINIAREIGSSPDEAWSYWALGLFYTLHGNFGDALEAVKDGIRIASDIGHREWLVGNLFALGVLYCEMLVPERALTELQRALDLAVELRSQYWITHVTGALASAYLLLGDLSSTQSSLSTVIENQTPMDTKGRRYCWARRAELAFAQGDTSEALKLTDHLIDSAAGMAPERVITFLWLLKGKTLAAMEQMDQAEALLRAASEHAQKTGERFLLWRIHGALGQLYLKMDRREKAAEETASARQLIEEVAATVPDQDLKENFRQRAFQTL